MAETIQARKAPPRDGTRLLLHAQQKLRPRPVHELTDLYVFTSENFNLLQILFSQLAKDDRASFIQALLERISGKTTARRADENDHNAFPSWNGFVSDLPLLAEFCIRAGYSRDVIQSVGESRRPSPGLALLLIQLEEIIALNFNLFSDSELAQIPSALSGLLQHCIGVIQSGKAARSRRRPIVASGKRAGKLSLPVMGTILEEQSATETALSISGIIEECRKARYWYLKGALQQKPNLEIEIDKLKVQSFLESLGFDPLLNKVLDEAEKMYRDDATPFELKNCLGHWRSFIEKLHADACAAIAIPVGVSAPTSWGEANEFLYKHGYLSKKQQQFVVSFYALMSDEGVHPLIAEREYARLLRNVVIEYGFLFLTILEKKDIRISAQP